MNLVDCIEKYRMKWKRKKKKRKSKYVRAYFIVSQEEGALTSV